MDDHYLGRSILVSCSQTNLETTHQVRHLAIMTYGILEAFNICYISRIFDDIVSILQLINTIFDSTYMVLLKKLKN